MNELTKKDQEKLIEFVRFFKSYNPDYRMAPVMQANFKLLRDECNSIVDKVYKPEF